MNTPSNPPAFPSHQACDSWQCRKPSSGMSLRDYFAAQIAPAVAAEAFRNQWAKGGPEWRDAVALEIWKIADTLLAAREMKD